MTVFHSQMLPSRAFSGALYLCLAVFASVLCGCGNEVSSDSIAESQDLLDQSKQLVADGDRSAALPLLETALEQTGLNVDQYAEALLYRAQCYAEAGQLEQANADLQEAEMGAPDPALMMHSKGVVLSAEGKDSEAKKAFSQAKRLDKSLNLPQ